MQSSRPKIQPKKLMIHYSDSDLTSSQSSSSSPSPTSSTPTSSRGRVKRRRSTIDKAYTGKERTNSNTSFAGIFGLLGSTTATVTRNGQSEEFKASIIVQGTSSLTNSSDDDLRELRRRIYREASAVKSYKKIKQVVESSQTGSPLKVSTPQGSILHRAEKNGHHSGITISIFNNSLTSPIPHNTPIKSVSAKAIESEANKENITLNTSPVKTRTIMITPDMFAKTAKEKELNGTSRNQNRVMKQSELIDDAKASAHELAKAAELDDGQLEWHWLHLVSNYVEGKRGQAPGNLVAGTSFGNLEMVPFEAQLKKISKAYPDGYLLTVSAYMVQGENKASQPAYTQLAYRITYEIETSDFTTRFEFNPQRKTAPHISYLGFVSAIFSGMLNFYANKPAEISSNQKFFTPTSGARSKMFMTPLTVIEKCKEQKSDNSVQTNGRKNNLG